MASVATLFSAGRDSTLAATLLDPFFDVTLCHCTFGVATDPPTTGVAADAAEALGFPVETVRLDEAVAREAVERMVADGYPRAGIQRVHEHALETLASGAAGPGKAVDASAEAVADGTRRDDRTPVVEQPFAQSLEDRHGVEYVRPLAGYGRGAVMPSSPSSGTQRRSRRPSPSGVHARRPPTSTCRGSRRWTPAASDSP